MHVGMTTIFQNPHRSRTDYDVYRNELRLADLAEPLGYESIWGVEHHFTDYTICPDVLQFLAYMAGRQEKRRLIVDDHEAATFQTLLRRRRLRLIANEDHAGFAGSPRMSIFYCHAHADALFCRIVPNMSRADGRGDARILPRTEQTLEGRMGCHGQG